MPAEKSNSISLDEAVEATGRSASTIKRYMRDKKLSRNIEDGKLVFRVDELIREFGELKSPDQSSEPVHKVGHDDAERVHELATAQLRAQTLQEQLTQVMNQLDQSKGELDRERRERTAERDQAHAEREKLYELVKGAQEQVKLLTDQREAISQSTGTDAPRRAWWPFR